VHEALEPTVTLRDALMFSPLATFWIGMSSATPNVLVESLNCDRVHLPPTWTHRAMICFVLA